MRKSPVQCIYCGDPGKLTREHIFGKRIAAQVPNKAKRSLHITSHKAYDPTSKTMTHLMGKGRLHREGDLYTQQLKLVCKTCNETWMGDIQKAAIPHVSKLINGPWPQLTNEIATIIATWATMATISYQFADMKTNASSNEERKYFHEHQLPPSNWIVCAARFNKSMGRIWHRGAQASLPEQIGLSNNPNMQTTTFCIGGALLHTLSAPPGILPNPGEYAARLGMILLWPLGGSNFRSGGTFTDMGARRIANVFWTDYLGVAESLVDPSILLGP